MSFLITPPTSILIEVFLNDTRIARIRDTDILLDAFEAHKSLCSDVYFRFGGCVSEWVKFTTTKTTYVDNGVTKQIPWDKVDMMVCFGVPHSNPDYSIMAEYGLFIGKSYEEKVNHTQVEVTAYDLMYHVLNLDLSDWYISYTVSNPHGTAIDTFYRAFMDQIVLKTHIQAYDLPPLMNQDTYVRRLAWQPYPMLISPDGTAQEKTLLTGVITGGKLLKELSGAFGCCAYMGGSGSQRGRKIEFFDMGSYTNVSLSPNDYTKFEWSTFDTTEYTNLRISVYDLLKSANNDSGMIYGISNNWVFNANVNTEIIDDPVIGDDDDPIKSCAGLLLDHIKQINDGIYRPLSVTAFGDKKYVEVGSGLAITDPQGNTFYGIAIQKDIKGITSMLVTFTSVETEDYYVAGDFTEENYSNSTIADLSGKLPITNDIVGTTVSWELRPTGWVVKAGSNNVITIGSGGLQIDAVSIKKNGTEIYPIPDATAIASGLMSATDFKKINPQLIAANTDLDTITTMGLYYCGNGGSVTNAPANATHFALIVNWSGNATARRSQIYIQGSSYNRIYYRIQTAANSWSTWERVANITDLPTKLSDLTDDVVSGNYVKLSSTTTQKITASNTSTVLGLKGSSASETWIEFRTNDDAVKGYIGVRNGKPVFYDTANRAIFYDGQGYVWQTTGGVAISATSDAHADLNTYTTTGTYYISSNIGNYVDNKPIASNNRFTLVVTRIGNYASCVRQIYMRTGDAYMFVRRTTDSGVTWSAWSNMVLASDLSSYATTASLANYLPLAGGTLTGVTHLEQATGDTYYYAKRTDTGVEVRMGVGSAGTNHGLYSSKLSKWMVYGDASTVHLNGVLEGSIATNIMQRGTVSITANSAKQVTFSPAFAGTPTVMVVPKQASASAVASVLDIGSSNFKVIGNFSGTVDWVAFYS